MSHHPEDSIPMWKKGSQLDRALDCATYLLVLGLISDGERQKIHQRMLKWVKRSRKEVSNAD